MTSSELRSGGLLLSLGTLITIICILLEVNAGWASLTVNMQRTDYEAGKFLFEHWEEMRSIWGWSMFGNVILAIAALLLFKNNRQIGIFPGSVLWAIYLIGSLLLIISFSMSLGSYYPALEVIDEQPFLFSVSRGTPLYLFNLGAISGFVVFIIYFYEGFSRHGIVPRAWAIATLVVLLLALVALILGWCSFTVFVIACFLVPLFLGIFYSKQSSV